MTHYSLSFRGVETTEQVNRITTALMMLDGVESVEVGRHGAEIEGHVKPQVLIETIQSLNLGIEVT